MSGVQLEFVEFVELGELGELGKLGKLGELVELGERFSDSVPPFMDISGQWQLLWGSMVRKLLRRQRRTWRHPRIFRPSE